MKDSVTYFCISCSKSVGKHERIKWARGGVCKDCFYRLTDQNEQPDHFGGKQRSESQLQRAHLEEVKNSAAG